MIRKPLFIGSAIIIAVLCTAAFFHFRIPSGVTPQGDSTETIAWISLMTAIVSMITAIVGLVQKILESRSRGNNQ
jgi:hypothetical protein